MLKVMTDVSLAAFASASVVASSIPSTESAGDGIYEWINRFGALALCAFMVFQNYRQSESLGKIITVKDQQNMALQREVLIALERNTQALAEMTSSLNERPCMAKKDN